MAGGLLSVVRWWLRLGWREDGDPAAAQERRLGRAGEREAARLLKRAGYRVLGRNVRVRIGEADLVCLAPDRATIVIVEVKTRRVEPARGACAGGFVPPPPEASVHARKRRKLVSVARYLARANGWMERPVRIDVVAVEWPLRGRPVLRHHVGAVTGGR